MSSPTPTLSYAPPPSARPGWVTRLAVTSLLLAPLGLVAGILRILDAWYVFDPAFRSISSSPPWVGHLYVLATLATFVISILLLTAGIVSLLSPRLAAPLHRLYAVSKLSTIPLTAAIHLFQRWPHPAFYASIAQALIGCAIFSAYPGIVLYVLHRNRPTE